MQGASLATFSSATGTRTRVARVRAEYPGQLDYSGCWISNPEKEYRGDAFRSLNLAADRAVIPQAAALVCSSGAIQLRLPGG